MLTQRADVAAAALEAAVVEERFLGVRVVWHFGVTQQRRAGAAGVLEGHFRAV